MIKRKMKKLFSGGGPMQQGPGNPPIRVTDPNDPRLSRYQDSLSIYNYGKAGAKDLLSMKEMDKEEDFIKRDTRRFPREAFDRLARYNGTVPDQVDSVSKQLGYYLHNRPLNNKNAEVDNTNNWKPYMVDQPLFKKPVQPYYYQPEKIGTTLKPSDIGNPIPIGSRGDITAASPASSSVTAQQQKTLFSFSGMNRETGQQNSVYFPDLKSWQDFTEKQGYLHRETSNNDSEAHATGYFKYGGDMTKRKLRKLFAGGNPDQDTSGNPTGMNIFTPTSDMTSGSAWMANPVTDPNSGTPNTSWLQQPSPDGGGGRGFLSGFHLPSINVDWKKAGADLQSAGARALPYASNIANAFRRPPMPAAPTTINPVTLSRVDLSDARNRISRTVRGQNLNADRSLNPQAAAAVRNANLAKEIEGTSQVSEQEAFLNSRQQAEQAGMNLNVESMNAQAQNNYHNEILQRNIAGQREQSGNLANAADKAIAQQNEQRKEQLDLKKINVLSQMWKNSGVYDRMMKKMKDQGMSDPTGILDQMDPTKAYGGPIMTSGGGLTFAFGGPGPGPGSGPEINMANAYKSISSGVRGADAVDHINSILSGASNALNSPYGDTHNALAMKAYLWRQQNTGRSPQEMIQGFYGQPVVGGNPVDSLRQQMNIYSPASMYNNTPNIRVRKAFGGFTAATKTFPMTRGRATGQGMISPFGSSRSVGLGSGIPHGKFNPKGVTRTHVFDKGGVVDQLQIDGTPDMLMTNGHSTMTPGVYKMGGTFMDYPIRPKALRRLDFAGIEHMAMGGVPGIFDADPYNVPYPTAAGGGWISKAVNPAHKGWCTPLSKSTCTGKRRAFALTMKKHHGFH